MTRRSLVLSTFVVPFTLFAQGDRKSPHETVTLEVNGKKIEIVYGRPSLKGRTAFTGELAPNGTVWRLGADEATKLTISGPAKMNGSLVVPAGSYALFAIPGPSNWTIIVNKTADQWGAFKYEKAQDLGRFEVPVHKGGSVEEFTIRLEKKTSDSATVSLAWQDASVSFPIQFS